LNNFKLRRLISPEQMKIFKQDKYLIHRDSLRIRRKCLVNFGPLTTKIWTPNHTHPNRLFRKTTFRKSTLRALRMVMHSSSGHMTLLLWNFNSRNFSPYRTYGAGQTHFELCPKFLVGIYFFHITVLSFKRRTTVIAKSAMTLQGHPRSMIFVSNERAYATFI